MLYTITATCINLAKPSFDRIRYEENICGREFAIDYARLISDATNVTSVVVTSAETGEIIWES